ncbi:MAG: hypothetical protein IT321_31005 [Anaerolineae bacterium]|nr:hypothetical protein [Anaerolineae bacterium]
MIDNYFAANVAAAAQPSPLQINRLAILAAAGFHTILRQICQKSAEIHNGWHRNCHLKWLPLPPNLPTDISDTDDSDDISDIKAGFVVADFAATADIKCTVKMKNLKLRQFAPLYPPLKPIVAFVEFAVFAVFGK